MYHKVEAGQIAYFDVDHTLIIWEMDPKEYDPSKGSGETGIYNLLAQQTESLHIEFNNNDFAIRPIWTHVSQLVQQKLKGVKIVVWSAGGVDWAEAVVKRLGLEEFVDVVVTKPHFFYDDSKPEGFMGRHFFFAWDEIDAKMKGKKQAAHDLPQVIKEPVENE